VVRRNTPEEKAESGGYAYTVVIGQRRLRAARSSKLGHVRAIFREYATEVEAYQASIVDNLAERNHLHPLDYSAALTELWSVGASVDFVKLKLELTDRRLSHHLRLANLHPGLRDLFYEGKISNSVAYTLLELTQDVQGDYARAIRNKGHEVTDPKKLRTVFRQVWRSRIEPKLLRQGRIA
jgi:ParB-like chromosome segregation protein Spo0J